MQVDKITIELLANIYQSLLDNRAVFAKLITVDGYHWVPFGVGTLEMFSRLAASDAEGA